MHAIEKILAKNSGESKVKTGEIVTAKVDFAQVIEEGTIKILCTNIVLQGDKIGEYAMGILEAGGIKPMFRARMAEYKGR